MDPNIVNVVDTGENDKGIRSWTTRHFDAAVRDTIAGTLSGAAGVLAGHPLDTIRVRMQLSTSKPRISTKEMYSGIISGEGFLGLLKGMASPILGVGFLSAMLFYAYGQITTIQLRFHEKQTLFDVWVAGTGAGLFQTLLLAPIENVKIRLQTQTDNIHKEYKGPVDCLQKLYKQRGLAGVYKGMNATILRDASSYGIYFLVYEMSKTWLSKGKQEAGALDMFNAGGIAGVLSWLSIYPVDVVKSRIQQDSMQNPKYSGIWDCFVKSYQNEGWKVFGRGLSPTLLRTFIVSGANFLVYESAAKFLHKG